MAPPVSTAQFGADEMAVTFPTSQYGGPARSIAFCASIQLSEAELVAALWLATSCGVAAEELADPAKVRAWVTGALVNSGLDGVEDARHEVASVTPGTAEHAWLQDCVAAVRRAFAPVLPAPARRALVGVA